MSRYLGIIITLCVMSMGSLMARDGRILSQNEAEKTVVINIGLAHGVTVKTWILVYERKKVPVKERAKLRAKGKKVKAYKRGRKVGLLKVTEVERTRSTCIIHRIHNDVTSLVGYYAVFDGLALEDRPSEYNLAPRMKANVLLSWGRTSGVEFRRDRYAPFGPAVTDGGLTDGSSLDFDGAVFMGGGGDFQLFPLSFARQRNIWKDMFGFGGLVRYGQFNFSAYSPDALTAIPVEDKLQVQATVLDAQFDMLFRFGKTVGNELYFGATLRVSPYVFHRIKMLSQTDNPEALMKTLEYRFVTIGGAINFAAIGVFDIGGFVDYPVWSRAATNWTHEEINTPGESTGRPILYDPPTYIGWGGEVAFSYQVIRLSVRVSLRDYATTNTDPTVYSEARYSSAYTTSENWMNVEMGLGGNF